MLLASLVVAGPAEKPAAISVDLHWPLVAIQLVLFVGLTLVLKPVLFDPMLKLFEEREKRIDGTRMKARQIDEQSAGALAKYEAEMARARALANADREKIRADALKREQEILGAVRVATAKALEAGKRAAHTEADKVRAALKRDAAAMARDLAGRALGREVQP
jgi:F-type H+-transporting ATPase subunit b